MTPGVLKDVAAQSEPGAQPPSDLLRSDRGAIAPLLITLSDPLSAGAEAIRALRTHVMAQHIQAGRRGLVICAASIDVGCSFVAANLAVALAQIGLKTLLVDGDLRSPAIDSIIPAHMPTRGLVGCLLTLDTQISEYIEADLLPNLSVLHAGAAAANSQELLARELFESLMHQCMRDYDITIVDTPPANTSADARRICNVVGYALVVARRNKSLVSDVKTLVEQLIDDHAIVIGTVMNAE
jgi:capsular exopolysaccharide synthesis family protein